MALFIVVLGFRKNEVYEQLLSCPIPCIVFCRELHPDEIFLKKAIEKGVPILMTKKATSAFTAEIISGDHLGHCFSYSKLY